jgi:propanediol dehydratase large subunit
VGSVDTVDDPGTATAVLNFTFNIGTIVSIGDLAYRNDAGVIEFIGPITGFTKTSITIDNDVIGSEVVNDGDYILYIKNSVAESYGARGYYMQYELENGSQDRVELFSVKSNVFKSYP